MGRGQGDHVGTGYPLTFRCPKERRERDWRGGNARVEARHAAIVRTGRTRPAPSPGKGHPRKLAVSFEFVCPCGHVGWSCHIDVVRYPLQEGKTEPLCPTCGGPQFETWRGLSCPRRHLIPKDLNRG